MNRGDWMQTFTGRQFFPLDPRPEDIDARDIAHALSMVCRFGGHVDRFYSVAEHCVLMSWAVSVADGPAALLHDAAEAYVGDMVRPLKYNLDLYREIEAGIWIAIAERFNVDVEIPVSVKEADLRILVTERNTLMKAPPVPWFAGEDVKPLPVPVSGWNPRRAEEQYLEALSNCGVDVP